MMSSRGIITPESLSILHAEVRYAALLRKATLIFVDPLSCHGDRMQALLKEAYEPRENAWRYTFQKFSDIEMVLRRRIGEEDLLEEYARKQSESE